MFPKPNPQTTGPIIRNHSSLLTAAECVLVCFNTVYVCVIVSVFVGSDPVVISVNSFHTVADSGASLCVCVGLQDSDQDQDSTANPRWGGGILFPHRRQINQLVHLNSGPYDKSFLFFCGAAQAVHGIMIPVWVLVRLTLWWYKNSVSQSIIINPPFSLYTKELVI